MLNRIGKISTYEVQEMELKQLDSIVASENQALGFTTFVVGVFVSTVIGWCSLETEGRSPTTTAVYFATMGVSLILTFWFGLTWYRARKDRPRLLETIRSRSVGGPTGVVR